MGGKYQQKPSLADVARRRGQSIFELLEEWGLDASKLDDASVDEYNAQLRKRCVVEGVTPVEFGAASVRNALVQLPAKESVDTAGKKRRKGKVVTHDDAAASGEHDGVDPDTSR